MLPKKSRLSQKATDDMLFYQNKKLEFNISFIRNLLFLLRHHKQLQRP